MLKQIQMNSPIIQAPMAGVTTPSFVAASCEAGALGFIAAGYLDYKKLSSFIVNVRSQTTKVFGVNIFIHSTEVPDSTVLSKALKALQPIYDDVALPLPATPHFHSPFDEQIEAVIDNQINIVSFTFGIPHESVLTRLKQNDVYLIGTATTKEEAIAIEQAGFDAVVLQGSEAGGHRGSFIEPFQYIPLQKLIAEAMPHLSIPVIGTGGIMTNEDVERILALGAKAVQIGTALLVSDECAIPTSYKNIILHSTKGSTRIMHAFTGKPARGFFNAFSMRMENAFIAPYPYQNLLTLPLRQLENDDYAFYLMGERSFAAKSGSIRNIVNTLSPTT